MDDPRNLDDEYNSDFDKLTDDEFVEMDMLEKEEQDALRKIEEIRRRKLLMKNRWSTAVTDVELDVGKTPSPIKDQSSVILPEAEIKPKNLVASLKAESSKTTMDHHNDITQPLTGPSYFIQKLQETKKKQDEQREHVKSIINSRVYTFDRIKEMEPTEVDEKEYFSGQHISRRYVQSDELERFLEDKKVMRLPKLFAKVSPPYFQEPRYPNWLVIAIIRNKSTPRPTSTGKGKYVFLTLTDFKYNIDLSLFGAAVEKYNKLRLGDVIAVLNPEIHIKSDYTTDGMKTFGLSIKHDGDNILEIAKSKHFGTCPALQKDGTVCGTPINKADEEICLFHRDLRIRKTAGKRMELQTSVRVGAPMKHGRRQQMFLGKPDPSGNWNAQVVTDYNAPKEDHKTRARKFFSSTNKHEKFFNSEIVDAQDITKKQKRQADYRKNLRDIELQKSLRESLQGAKNLKKHHPIDNSNDKDDMTLEEKKALLRYAYGQKGLNSLGFDPSAKGSSKGLLSAFDEEQKLQASNTANELRNITKNKKINFALSKSEIERRRNMRKETDEMLKRIKSEGLKATSIKTEHPLSSHSPSHTPTSRRLMVELGSDSDDDLEILDVPNNEPTSNRPRE